MGAAPITTIPELQLHLQSAIALELSTIPPYLCGMWTIREQSNACVGLIRGVVMAEMRHMNVAANCLLATGGTPDVTGAAPTYPSYLADGEDEFEVDLLPFGPGFLAQGLAIEQPETPAKVPDRLRALVAAGKAIPRRHRLLAMGSVYPTIGAFYRAIIGGITYLVAQDGEGAVFPDGGNPGRQVGDAFPGTTITSSESAIALLTDIVDEGEGTSGTMWDETGRLSHYYTFQETSLGRAYQQGDQPGRPSGPPIAVPSESQVYPMLPNPRMADYGAASTKAWQDADAFNQTFGQIVQALQSAFTGTPDSVWAAIGAMDALGGQATTLFGDAVPDQPGLVAGPTFELPPYHPQTSRW